MLCFFFKIGGKKGFASIVEVAVTAVIFVLATGGILSTISILKPHEQTSSAKLEAAYVGKGVIDGIRKEVNAAPGGVFYGPNLALGVHNSVVNGYTISYTVTEPIPNVRKLVMTVTW